MGTEAGVEADADLTSEYVMRRYGVSARTLLFYEEQSLLSPKQVGAIRLYSTQDTVRLELILASKKLGLPLREIGEIIRSHEARPRAIPTNVATNDFVSIQRRLALLEAQKTGLDAAITELHASLIGSRASVADD